jgi:hypothetical protein
VFRCFGERKDPSLRSEPFALTETPGRRQPKHRNTATPKHFPFTSHNFAYELKPPAAKARKEALLKNIEPMKEWAKDGK